jgi:hypothetical protein
VITSKTQQVIERPAADVWSYAADIVRQPEWMNVADAEPLGGTGSEVGSRGARASRARPVDGLADFGPAKAGWFKESEGNTYELSEVVNSA